MKNESKNARERKNVHQIEIPKLHICIASISFLCRQFYQATTSTAFIPQARFFFFYLLFDFLFHISSLRIFSMVYHPKSFNRTKSSSSDKKNRKEVDEFPLNRTTIATIRTKKLRHKKWREKQHSTDCCPLSFDFHAWIFTLATQTNLGQNHKNSKKKYDMNFTTTTL